MAVSTRPLGLPYPGVDLATWWPELDFRVEAAVVEATLVRATETDSARSLTVTKYVDLVRATETSAAHSVTVAHYADLGRATETDVARTLAVSQALPALPYIPSARPMYRSKDWTEIVREADPAPPPYVKYRFSNGREFT